MLTINSRSTFKPVNGQIKIYQLDSNDLHADLTEPLVKISYEQFSPVSLVGDRVVFGACKIWMGDVYFKL